MAAEGRPLSPHLGVYGWYLTMALSILHRATGAALALGLLLLAWWLIALASGPEAFAAAQGALGSPLGLLVLFAFSLAWWYHLLNGARHLAWDAGYNLGKAEARRSGVLVLAATAALTLLTWIAAALVG